MVSHRLCLALSLASIAAAQSGGRFSNAGNTLVSAVMMFLGNDEKVYILDKAEGNAAQINGRPAWGSVWNYNTKLAVPLQFTSNPLGASGMHLPNGSYATFGGNLDFNNAQYGDTNGLKSIRVINPCDGTDLSNPLCQWFDSPSLSLNASRWYSAAEALGDGTVVLIGGFTMGGYVNRNFPNLDPDSGGLSENSFEFYPDNGRGKTTMQFMRQTSGLNAFAHAYLMPSGKVFLQANLSTILWQPETNAETPLPNMPNGIVRVYPASGAVAMLPLTPANSFTPTILFCGGSDLPADAYGDFQRPAVNTFNRPASTDCQRITPEPADGSAPIYTAEDNLPQGRTMGQFVALPTGQMLILNGAASGTAGSTNNGTGETPQQDQLPYGQSLAANPVLTPVLFTPSAVAGRRWSSAGLSNSTIPRMFRSAAVLLPDGSVLVAGSNPNLDVNTSAVFPTTYQAEYFYPPYFAAKIRPTPVGFPSGLSYGGNPFDITVAANNFSGRADWAAGNASVVVIRPGFSTHGVSMGQRMLQLNSTYTVNSDGSFILHTSQLPPNPNLLTPGPALMFVVVNGIPSIGKIMLIGSGSVGAQLTSPVTALPASIGNATVFGTADAALTAEIDPLAPGAFKGSDIERTHADVVGVFGIICMLVIIGALIAISLAERANKKRRSSSRMLMYDPGETRAPKGGASGGQKGSVMPLYDDRQQQAGPDASLAYPSGPYHHGNASEHSVGAMSNFSDTAPLNPRR